LPIRPPNLYPPFNVVRIAYVDCHVSDLALSKAFWVEALGFVVTEETSDALYLRGLEERNHHSVVLRKSSDLEVSGIGFKVYSEDDLDKAAAFCDAKGLPYRFVQRPAQGRTLAFHDPLGTPIELFFKMNAAPSMLRQYGAYRGAYVQRIDHVNCFSPDVQASYDFFTEMGFRTTEYAAADDTDQLWSVWLHRKGNVHDIAFTSGRGPRFHHVGMWVSAVTDIIHMCDVLSTTGWLASMERGPGRHGLSNAFFLYLRDPDGHRVELFTSDYLTVDPDHQPTRWDLRDPQRQTLWGMPAPRSWFEEGSLFTGQAVRDPVLHAQPIVAPW
jgi:3,4-dihydroxyphenylacetate 2,3-dioxygenase